jgi:hypothetical protein
MNEFKLNPKPIEPTDSHEVKMAKYQIQTFNMIEDAIRKSFERKSDAM